MITKLIEDFNSAVKLTEDTNHKYIEGIAAIAGQVNQNGRVYSRTLWEREIPKLMSNAAARPGTLGHPEFTSHPKDNVAIFEDFTWKGEELWFRARIIQGTQAGKDLIANLEAGVEVGVSSRGTGSVNVENYGNYGNAKVVQEDFQLETFDVVNRPSVAESKIRWDIYKEDLNNMKKNAPQLLEDVDPKMFVLETPEIVPEVTPVEKEEVLPKKEDVLPTPQVEATENLKPLIEAYDSKISLLESKNKKLNESVNDYMTAILVLKNAISDVLADDKFYTAMDLLSMVATLSMMKENELQDIAQDVMDDVLLPESKLVFTGLIENIATLSQSFKKDSLAKFIDEVLEGNTYANILRPMLKECNSKEDVTIDLAKAKILIENLMNYTAMPTGIPSEIKEEEKSNQYDDIIAMYRKGLK